MACASLVFVHAAPTEIWALQIVQSRYLRLAVGVPRYMRNMDLHEDLDLEPFQKYELNLTQNINSISL